MKNLLLILALLSVFSTIPCKAQATFKQAFINMPLAPESSLRLQPIKTPLSRTGAGLLSGGFLVVGFALVVIGRTGFRNRNFSDWNYIGGDLAVIILGGGLVLTGGVLLDAALTR